VTYADSTRLFGIPAESGLPPLSISGPVSPGARFRGYNAAGCGLAARMVGSVNVAHHHKIRMEEPRTLYERLGLLHAQTYVVRSHPLLEKEN